MKRNRFVIIMPCFNAEATITQSLMSVISQSYNNWKVIIRDDMSTDKTRAIIDNIIRVFGLQERIIVETNKEKKWEVRNILEMLSLSNEVNDDDIICRLDGDDWLTDLDSFAILNDTYNRTEAEVIWTGHRWGFTDHNISNELPKDADPYEHPWVSSHFKTFRKLTRHYKRQHFPLLGEGSLLVGTVGLSSAWGSYGQVSHLVIP